MISPFRVGAAGETRGATAERAYRPGPGRDRSAGPANPDSDDLCHSSPGSDHLLQEVKAKLPRPSAGTSRARSLSSSSIDLSRPAPLTSERASTMLWEIGRA